MTEELNRLKVKKESLIKKVAQNSLAYLNLLEDNDVYKAVQQKVAEEIVNLDINVERRLKEKILSHIEKVVNKHLNNLKKSYSSLEYYFKHPNKALNDEIEEDIISVLESETSLKENQLSNLTNSFLFDYKKFATKDNNMQEVADQISESIKQLGKINRRIKDLEKDLQKDKESEEWNKLINSS